MANYGFKISPGVNFKLEGDSEESFTLKMLDTLTLQPDVLSEFDEAVGLSNFKNWTPKIRFAPASHKVYLTKESYDELDNLLSNPIELYNVKEGFEDATFNDPRVFQIGVIVVKHHRSNRRTGKRKFKKLTPWFNDRGRLKPSGASVIWGGCTVYRSVKTEDNKEEITTKKRVNLTLSPTIGSEAEIQGFDKLLEYIYPISSSTKDGWHKCYYFGLIFRLRDPYRNIYVTTNPSDSCICRWADDEQNKKTNIDPDHPYFFAIY